MRDFESRNERRRERWEEKRKKWEERMERHRDPEHHAKARIWTGLFLLLIGGISLAKSFGVFMPPWLFTWQMLLIVIGLFIGLRSGFTNGGWFVPILIGGAFLMNDYVLNGELRRHLWPLILICMGIVFIFRPRRRGRSRWSCDTNEKKSAGINPDTSSSNASTASTDPNNYSEDDYIDTTSIFGGTKKVILSKNFRGGDMVNIFGGSEIDLTRADMQPGTAELEVTAMFGGATLIVPSNWAVKSEAMTIFGGISDKRSISGFENSGKNLVIKGTVIFGGIEIKSY
ncbi:MAG: LiaF domain-containing protein [Chitinophagaceae bacterium]